MYDAAIFISSYFIISNKYFKKKTWLNFLKLRLYFRKYEKKNSITDFQKLWLLESCSQNTCARFRGDRWTEFTKIWSQERKFTLHAARYQFSLSRALICEEKTKTTAKKSVSFSFFFRLFMSHLLSHTGNVQYSIDLPATNLLLILNVSLLSDLLLKLRPSPIEGTWKKRFFRKRANSRSHKIDSREWTTADSFVLRSNSTWLCASSKRLLPVSSLNSIRNNNLPAAFLYSILSVLYCLAGYLQSISVSLLCLPVPIRFREQFYIYW